MLYSNELPHIIYFGLSVYDWFTVPPMYNLKLICNAVTFLGCTLLPTIVLRFFDAQSAKHVGWKDKFEARGVLQKCMY